MLCALLLLSLLASAMSLTTTRRPFPDVETTVPDMMTTTGHPNHAHHDTLSRLIQHEVTGLLNTHPGLTVDHCSTKCDAVFDLVMHNDEHLTDRLCKEQCSRAINGHHHTTTMAP